jgi:hypothetical protein
MTQPYDMEATARSSARDIASNRSASGNASNHSFDFVFWRSMGEIGTLSAQP